MKQDLTRRALLVGTGATVIGVAVAATAQTHEASTDSEPQRVACRHALVVDVSSCSRGADCRACIDACHDAHAVPTLSDPRHEVKWVWKAPFAGVFPEQIHPLTPPAQRQLPVLVTCNHCSSPPCTRVCPTRATWKRADGIVAMDPHRCIGCRYCMAACPYGARSFNWEKLPKSRRSRPYPQRDVGIVEKCTLCVDRIDAGQAPVCVEACMKTGRGALSFGDLTNPDSRVARLLATRQVLRRKPKLGTQPNVYYLV